MFLKLLSKNTLSPIKRKTYKIACSSSSETKRYMHNHENINLQFQKMIESKMFGRNDLLVYLDLFEKSLINNVPIDIMDLIIIYSDSKKMFIKLCQKYNNKEIENKIERFLSNDGKYKVSIELNKNNPKDALMIYHKYIKEVKSPNIQIFEKLILTFTKDYPPIYIINLLMGSYSKINPEIFLPYFRELFVDKSRISSTINKIETILPKCQELGANTNLDLLSTLLDIYSYNHNFESAMKIFQLIPPNQLSENHYFTLIRSNSNEGNDLIINHYVELYLKLPNANRNSIFELYLEELSSAGNFLKIEEMISEYSKNDIPMTADTNIKLLKAYTIGDNRDKAISLCEKILSESKVNTKNLSVVLYCYASFNRFEAVEEILENNKDMRINWNYSIFHKILSSSIINDEFDYFEYFYGYLREKGIELELHNIIELLTNCKKIERFDKLLFLIDLFSHDFPNLKNIFQIKKFIYDISQNVYYVFLIILKSHFDVCITYLS